MFYSLKRLFVNLFPVNKLILILFLRFLSSARSRIEAFLCPTLNLPHVFLSSLPVWTYPRHSNPCRPAWVAAGTRRNPHSCVRWPGCGTCSSLCCHWGRSARRRRPSAAGPPGAPAGSPPHPQRATPEPESHSGSPVQETQKNNKIKASSLTKEIWDSKVNFILIMMSSTDLQLGYDKLNRTKQTEL